MNDLFPIDISTANAIFRAENLQYLPSSQDVPCQLHFGKVALADGLEEAVVADVGMLLRGGEGVAASWQAVATRRLCGRDWRFHKAVHRGVLENIYIHRCSKNFVKQCEGNLQLLLTSEYCFCAKTGVNNDLLNQKPGVHMHLI